MSDFSTDEDGHIKVFKRIADEDSDDEMHPKFLNKRKGKKVTILLACLKSKNILQDSKLSKSNKQYKKKINIYVKFSVNSG